MHLNFYYPFGMPLFCQNECSLPVPKNVLWKIMLHRGIFSLHTFYRFPFDWKNPIGFLVSGVLTYVFTLFTFTLAANIGTIGVGTNLYVTSLAKDIKSILNRISDSGKISSKQSKKSKGSKRSKHLKHSIRSQIIQHITEYVQFHSKAKELRAI